MLLQRINFIIATSTTTNYYYYYYYHFATATTTSIVCCECYTIVGDYDFSTVGVNGIIIYIELTHCDVSLFIFNMMKATVVKAASAIYSIYVRVAR